MILQMMVIIIIKLGVFIVPNSTKVINDTVQKGGLLVTAKEVGLKFAPEDREAGTLPYAARKQVP